MDSFGIVADVTATIKTACLPTQRVLSVHFADLGFQLFFFFPSSVLRPFRLLRSTLLPSYRFVVTCCTSCCRDSEIVRFNLRTTFARKLRFITIEMTVFALAEEAVEMSNKKKEKEEATPTAEE